MSRSKSTVLDPDGKRWIVKRKSLDDRKFRIFRRYRNNAKVKKRDLFNWLDIDVGEGILFVIAAIIFVILTILIFVYILAPLIILAAELLIFAVIAITGIVSRVIFKKPWQIEAIREDGLSIERNVVGFKASKREIQKMISEIEQGKLV